MGINVSHHEKAIIPDITLMSNESELYGRLYKQQQPHQPHQPQQPLSETLIYHDIVMHKRIEFKKDTEAFLIATVILNSIFLNFSKINTIVLVSNCSVIENQHTVYTLSDKVDCLKHLNIGVHKLTPVLKQNRTPCFYKSECVYSFPG